MPNGTYGGVGGRNGITSRFSYPIPSSATPTSFCNSDTDEQKKEVIQATSDEFKRMHNEISDINKTLNVRDSLADVLPFISVSHLSKRYFGKSASWFYQRMNGNIVHGKPAKFLPEEVDTPNFAIKDISTKLGAVRISC